MTLPRILVVDDQYARDPTERRLFLRHTCLRDLMSPGKEGENQIIAEALFSAGQRNIENKNIDNDFTVVAEAVRSVGTDMWALVLLDMRFDSGALTEDGVPRGRPGDDSFGEKVRLGLARDFPDLPVVVMTGKQHTELGNRDVAYLSKDGLDTEAVTGCLLRHGRLTTDQARRLLGLVPGAIASAPGSVKAFREAWRAARGTHSILLQGETGTGKEILARYIHAQSGRGDFVGLNIAAVPSTLFEAEMFGAMKGAFTNLTADRPGFFERADRGTLFLDEIADMDLDAQAKVLRALEEGKSYRIGARNPYSFDVRLISATSRDLASQIAEGKFREDLYYRIAADTIVVPPLRERREDIGPLAAFFLDQAVQASGKQGLVLTSEAVSRLEEHDFPGNVRELKHVTTRLAAMGGRNQALTARDVDQVLSGGASRDQRSGTIVPLPLQASAVTIRRSELAGALKNATTSYGQTAVQLVEKALDETRHLGRDRGDQLGDLNPTAAMKLLLSRADLTTVQAADEIKRIGAIIGAVESGSVFARVLEWARALRRTDARVPRLKDSP